MKKKSEIYRLPTNLFGVYIFRDDSIKSHKYWRLASNATTDICTASYGKMNDDGSYGTPQFTDYTPQMALKKVTEKLAKGYCKIKSPNEVAPVATVATVANDAGLKSFMTLFTEWKEGQK